MAGDAILNIKITSDARAATAGIDQATSATRKLGTEAKTAADRIDHVGSKAGQATTGLRDMSDAVAMAGFPQFAAGMQVAAVGLESIDGAATLFAATQGILTKATRGAAMAFNTLKWAIMTNPIFIIAAIVIAIGAAFVLLYMKCETFRKIVDAAFKVFMNVISGVFNWAKKNWPLLLAILTGPIGLAVLFVVKNFDKIKSIISGVIDWIGNVFEKVFDHITAPFRMAMQWIKDHVKFPSLPSWLPGGSKAAPSAAAYIPSARAGGTTTRTTAGPTIIIQAGIGDPHEIARQIRRILRDDASRLGRRHPQPYGQPA